MTIASPYEIKNLLEQYKDQSEKIEENIIEICYHMKGGISWLEAWSMSPLQRNKIVEYINKIMQAQEEQMTGKKQL